MIIIQDKIEFKTSSMRFRLRQNEDKVIPTGVRSQLGFFCYPEFKVTLLMLVEDMQVFENGVLKFE